MSDHSKGDARLASIDSAMHRFADAHRMELKPRYFEEPAWNFTWTSGAVTRKVQLTIVEGPGFTDVVLHSMAWSDELGLERIFEGHARSYRLRLPVSEDLFLETIELARKDAESLVITS